MIADRLDTDTTPTSMLELSKSLSERLGSAKPKYRPATPSDNPGYRHGLLLDLPSPSPILERSTAADFYS